MKILHTVQLYHPYIGGSEEVIKQLSERLAKRRHDITIATTFNKNRAQKTINGVKIKEFHISGNSIFGITGQKETYEKFLLENNFDIMLNYGTQIWSTDLALPLLSRITAKKVLVPVGFQGLNNKIYHSYYEKMPEYLAQYNQVVYLSKNYQDRNFAQKHHLKNDIIIPNAANEDEFSAPSINFREKYNIKTPYLLLSVSNHYPLKGHKFLIEAFKRLNRKDITLAIIGGKPVNFGLFFFNTCYYYCKRTGFFNKNLRILNNITRADTIAAFKACDLFVFGSSFECSPLVIFESMAAKKPFISTDCGNVKDFAEYGSIIKTPAEMTEKITGWLNNEQKRKTVGEKAYQNWQKYYTWETITTQYENLYKNLLKS